MPVQLSQLLSLTIRFFSFHFISISVVVFWQGNLNEKELQNYRHTHTYVNVMRFVSNNMDWHLYTQSLHSTFQWTTRRKVWVHIRTKKPITQTKFKNMCKNERIHLFSANEFVFIFAKFLNFAQDNAYTLARWKWMLFHSIHSKKATVEVLHVFIK